MATPAVRLTASQLDDLAVVCALGHEGILSISRALDAVKGTIKREKFRDIANGAGVGKESVDAVTRLLFGLATAGRRRSTPIRELLGGISEFLKARWDEAKVQTWDDCQPALEQLFSSNSMLLITKAADLSVDFERSCLGARILTDIRPVFDDLRHEIIGAVITQTLRLDYVSPDGDFGTISVALDSQDIARLRSTCDDAIRKAGLAKKAMPEKIPVIAVGEES